MVTYSRPGYGDSTPARGRSVADAAADSLGLRGEAVLQPWLEEQAQALRRISGAEAEALGRLVSDVDRAWLTGEFA